VAVLQVALQTAKNYFIANLFLLVSLNVVDRCEKCVGMSLTEYKNALRHLELNAYCSVVSALRAQGDLTPEKRRLLKELQTSLK